MKKLFLMAATLMLMFSAVIIPQPRAADASEEPVLTYVRFNRYGGDIYTTFCIASATNYKIAWGEESPSIWSTSRLYGPLNGCTTKYLFSGVTGGEVLSVTIYLDTSEWPPYIFYIDPQGSANIHCANMWPHNVLKKDDRINSDTACAFIEIKP